MEHRWSARKPINGNVVIECPRLGLVRAAIRDVSLGGMLLEKSPAVLPLNAPVTVVFALPQDDQGGYCMQAMIVRQTSNGAALMFLDPEAEVIRSMRNTLYGPMISSAPRRVEVALAADASGSGDVRAVQK